MLIPLLSISSTVANCTDEVIIKQADRKRTGKHENIPDSNEYLCDPKMLIEWPDVDPEIALNWPDIDTKMFVPPAGTNENR